MWEDQSICEIEHKDTGQKLKKNITHNQQHNVIIYVVITFKVEKLDQPQNVRATKCKSYLPFSPSIKQSFCFINHAWVHS